MKMKSRLSTTEIMPSTSPHILQLHFNAGREPLSPAFLRLVIYKFTSLYSHSNSMRMSHNPRIVSPTKQLLSRQLSIEKRIQKKEFSPSDRVSFETQPCVSRSCGLAVWRSRPDASAARPWLLRTTCRHQLDGEPSHPATTSFRTEPTRYPHRLWILAIVGTTMVSTSALILQTLFHGSSQRTSLRP
jgi:hypothetical protein